MRHIDAFSKIKMNCIESSQEIENKSISEIRYTNADKLTETWTLTRNTSQLQSIQHHME